MFRLNYFRNLHHLKPKSPFVRVFIITDGLFWFSNNLIVPFFAVFATSRFPNGSITLAATALSSYFISRVVTELISSRILTRLSENKKIAVIVLGVVLTSFSYLGFGYSSTSLHLYFFWILLGIGVGIMMPSRLALFSIHLDKNQETVEWGTVDMTDLLLVAAATMIGGYLAGTYGFNILFELAAIINLIALAPLIGYIKRAG